MIGRLLILTLGALALFASQKAKAAYDLTYKIVKIEILGVRDGLLRLDLNFNIMNQSREMLWFSDLSAGIFADAIEVGRVMIRDEVRILPNTTTLLLIPVGIDLNRAGRAALQYVITGKLPLLRIRGNMQVSGITFPIDQEYST